MGRVELARLIGDVLREEGQTLSVAESCTGGLLSDRITNVSGSSDYFEGGLVSYSIEAKAEHLGIPPKYIERYGAVSSRVAKKMAEGVRQAFHTTYGLSTTGVAGPTGGTKKTPVGTVFLGFSDGTRARTKRLRLHGTRREIKEEAAERCLQLLSDQLALLITNPPNPPSLKGGRRGFLRFASDASVVKQRIEQLRHSKESEIVIIHRAPKGISGRKGRLGIFPASFNPPSMAHVTLIKEAMEQGRLDEILILLDIQAMDKEPVGAVLEDRLTMLKKAFGRDLKVSIGLSNRGLFLEKIEPLRKYYPTPISFFFIVGFDTILRVMDKKYYPNRRKSLVELFNRSHFLVANRENDEKKEFEKFFNRKRNREYGKKVSFFNLSRKVSFISSSLVRKRIAEGKPVKGLIPAALLRWIQEKGHYKKTAIAKG